MKSESGFTITELVIALSLSTMVMIGLIAIATSIVRQHYESIRKGEANTTTLYAMQQMNRELELATLIQTPSIGTPTGNTIVGCVNWSRYLNNGAGGALDTDTGNSSGAYIAPYWFSYCVRADGNDSQGRPMFSLLRHTGAGCADPVAAPTCTGGETVVQNRFYTNGVSARFERTNDRRLRLRYTIGIDTPTPQEPSPAFYKVDTTVSAEKSYAATND